MEDTKLNVTLKSYLDEKFENVDKRFDIIDQKVNMLDEKISKEHDKILSLEKDLSYFNIELHNVQKEHKECLDTCNRRRSDIDKKIMILVEPKIKEAISGLRIWIISGVVTILLALVAYLIINFFTPAIQHSQDTYNKTQTEIIQNEKPNKRTTNKTKR